jgi:ribulose-phosphate 3-epimerase
MTGPRNLIAPSILSADFANLQAEAAAVRGPGGADWLHVDVMDNHFVPNLTIGLPVVRALKRVTDIPLDCHLMIEDPDRWAIGYAEAGAHNVTVHAEAVAEPISLAMDLKAAGALAGLSLKPGTALDDWTDVLRSYDTLLIMTVEPGFGGQAFMADMMDKVRRARRMVDTGHLRVIVQVDGGINAETIARAAEAGADCFVAGSAVYGAQDPAAAITALRELAAAAQRPAAVGQDG